MGQIRRHAGHVCDIVQRQLADHAVHLQQEAQRLANAACGTQHRHLPARDSQRWQRQGRWCRPGLSRAPRASIALDAKTGSECLSKPRWAHLASITAWLREALTTCWRDATSRCSARMLDCCPIAFMPLKVAKRCTLALQRGAASLAVAEQGERVLAVAAAMIESSVRKEEGIAERHDVCI